jgi:hypothetical protein
LESDKIKEQSHHAGTERYDFLGGPEHDREKAWTEVGIPLSDDHRQGLEDIAHELRVPIPWR